MIIVCIAQKNNIYVVQYVTYIEYYTKYLKFLDASI